MDYKPRCIATVIGSMPQTDPEQALDLIFSCIPETPIWPQLPNRGMNEQMEIQFSEGLPRIRFDSKKRGMYFDTTCDCFEELITFCEGYLRMEGGDYSSAVISEEHAAGISALESRLKYRGKLPFVKCQITGPISFGLRIVDETGKAIYYNDIFMDAIVQGLAMKSRWQIQKFKPYADRVICFVDEPMLCFYGNSRYLSVQRDNVVAKLDEVITAIRTEGGISGIHCCGNTEWSILIDAGADIVSFDSYTDDLGETIALYPEHMKRHLVEKQNALAWGIVPASKDVHKESKDSLVELFERLTSNLAKQTGIDESTIKEQAIITPSCGTGSMAVEDAEMVFQLLAETSHALMEKYCFSD